MRSEEGVSEDLHDYEEPRGRLEILLHRTRWKWLITGILGLSFIIPFVIAHIVVPENDIVPPPNTPDLLFMPSPSQSLSSSSSGKSRENNRKSLTVRAADYTFIGCESSGSLVSFTDFEGLAAACSLPTASTTDDSNNKIKNKALTSISLSNVNLDAAQLSSSLEACSDLKFLRLENISLIGNLTRVVLPKLSKFVYVQNKDDKRDTYKSPETLKQTLFFDKQRPSPQSPPWNVEQDLLNLGVDITIRKGGTRLIDIQHETREVYLNIKYCETLILNAKVSYDSLTLINCNVTEASIPVIPSTLKYLNVRNAVQRTPHLATLLRRLGQLEELYIWLTFHCDWPGYELFLNLNDLPPTIKTVGINNVDTTFVPGEGTSTSIRSLTVGDYTTNTTVSQGFPLLLKNLERLNVVNMSDPSPAAGYGIINTAIEMRVKEIAVVNLRRNYSTEVIGSEREVVNVETVLDQAGIPIDAVSCFILRRNNGSGYSGRKLSAEEQHQIRYNGLGFDKMDSWEDYLKWDAL